MQAISIQELFAKHEQLKTKEIILDVRTPEEFSEGHVPGSRNISHDQLVGRVGELKEFENLYIYCRSGGRAQFAAQVLAQSGIRNLSLVIDGGMPDWVLSGYPVER